MRSRVSNPFLVSDTSLLLYLGRIKHLHLLPDLFETVLVPEPVVFELDVGRMLRSDTVNPGSFNWISIIPVSQEELEVLPPNQLGQGERSVIALTLIRKNCIAGLDDRQARLLAQEIGLRVIGLVGILVKAKRAGIIPAVRPVLDKAGAEGFRLHTRTYAEALRLSNEA